MQIHRVLILGDSPLAEAVAQMLNSHHLIQITAIATSSEEAFISCVRDEPDILFVIGTADETIRQYLPILARYPHLPVLRSDVATQRIQVILSCCIEARFDQLLAAITQMPVARSTNIPI